MHFAREKIGIDANRPTDPQTGELAPQVADPTAMAETGAGCVRLNFVIAPWSSPNDATFHTGRTWAGAYHQIIANLRANNLAIYGLVGHEAVRTDPGALLSDAPRKSTTDHPWIQQYVTNFVTIVRLFQADVQVFESFNEPDNWRDGRRNWLHPGWFAILLQQLHRVIRDDPTLAHVRLVSGPVQGLATNNNAGAAYLRSTYREGKRRFGWGRSGRPFPFDGVGYHLYVAEEFKAYLSPEARRQELVKVYERYMGEVRAVIRSEEGRDKPIYLSEFGWNTNRNPEEFQAESLRVALRLILADPYVRQGIWFCTQDFGPPDGNTFYGLYRIGALNAEARKPAFDAYEAICAQRFDGESDATSADNGMQSRAVSLAATEARQNRSSARGQPAVIDATGINLSSPLRLVPVEPAGSNIAAETDRLPSTKTPVLSPAEVELLTNWAVRIRKGMVNTSRMLNRIYPISVIPNYVTVGLYALLFFVGLGMFGTAAWLGPGPGATALLCGGLGALTILVFLLPNPLCWLEGNRQFIAQLGIIYNTYWTRVLTMQEHTTAHTDFKGPTERAIAELKQLLDTNS